MAASLAVPTPASTNTGTLAFSLMIEIVCGFKIPKPEPIKLPKGMMATQPMLSSSCATIGSSEV